MRRLVLALLALALATSACGGQGEGGAPSGEKASGETASLWVTRDRGAVLLLRAEVPAGLTVLEALKREADVETRYGGRFVQAIDGIEGGLAKGADWFYFMNGIEPSIGSASVTLRPGDIAWWDFRSWRERMQQPVVVGAFPEPFLHGFAGRRRPVEVLHPPELAAEAEGLRRLLGDGGSGEPNRFVLHVKGGARGAALTAKRGAANDSPVTFELVGSLEAVRAAAARLAADPAIVRYRYEARFDERGVVRE
ncbi:MAG: DUF4430 domain-containing protein [Actinomycetota bacterium]|nr:DUF4430 domain-containing protein [Actinomycetota bacterium]